MVCGNSIVLRVFGPKREAVNGGTRKLYNGEYLSTFSSSKIIKSIKTK
jgi:hypothetical protein